MKPRPTNPAYEDLPDDACEIERVDLDGQMTLPFTTDKDNESR